MNPLYIIAIVLIAFMVVRTVIRYRTLSKQVDYLNNILYHEMQPDKYVEELDKIIAKSKNTRDKDINLLQKATGLFYAGRFEEVEDVINNKMTQIPMNGHHLYYQNLILSMIFNGEVEEGHKKLEEASDALNTAARTGRNTSVIEFIFAVDDVFQGKCNERKEFFADQCENGRNCYKRAIAYYCMAKICKNEDDLEGVKSNLEQAKEIGKNSFVEKIAEKEIKSL